VKAEVSGTTRAGILRFQFLRGGDGSIVIENNARGGDGWVRVDDHRQEVTGKVPVRRVYSGSGKLTGFSGYFVVEFSKPFHGSGTWVGPEAKEAGEEQIGDALPIGGNTTPQHMGSVAATSPVAASAKGERPGFGAYVRFRGVKQDDVVVARVGTSFVSLEEARKNLRSEIPGFDFERVRNAAEKEWNKSLGLIAIADDIPAKTVFYTAMYHALLHPRTYSDVDGSYPEFAGGAKVEHADGFVYYDDFSMWDIFRAQLPMLTILDPKRDVDMVRSLMAKADEGGFLPIFPLWNSYTSEMIGDHSAVAIIDAYRKGLTGFDAEHAYEAMRKNAMELPKDVAEYRDGKGRRGLESYLKYGYIPLEDHIPEAFHRDEQVSRTLEYAYDDAMIGEMASALGKKDDSAIFQERGQNWRKAIDPTTGFATGRHADGTWMTNIDPATRYSWITEGTPWVYTFFVPQDVAGLMELEGGKAKFVSKLDALFAGKHYDHGNEPSHHIAYLFDAGGAGWKTQEHVRSLMESEYRDSPGGLAGNDDSGQMSAWYVMSALGLYQVTPGMPEYWLGSPRFDEALVTLPDGKVLRVLAKGAGEGKVYVRRVLWNGVALEGYTIQHRELVRGGVLQFEMSEYPVP
jgi:predicted alpha-1,2-mannosidase